MTRSRINAAVVAERVAWIVTMLTGIRALPLLSLEDFDADPRNAAAAESYLRRTRSGCNAGPHLLDRGSAHRRIRAEGGAARAAYGKRLLADLA